MDRFLPRTVPSATGALGAPFPTQVGLLLLRVFAGLSLALAHGVGKIPPGEGFVELVAGMGFPAPLFFAWAAALAESAGGLALALGLLARPAAALVAVNMFVAAFVLQGGDPFLERELALLYLFVALALTLTGPGRLSLDAALAESGRKSLVPAPGGAD